MDHFIVLCDMIANTCPNARWDGNMVLKYDLCDAMMWMHVKEVDLPGTTGCYYTVVRHEITGGRKAPEWWTELLKNDPAA